MSICSQIVGGLDGAMEVKEGEWDLPLLYLCQALYT
jgi:hypothetical protein